MKTQILERLHALATDFEEVGLSKYAEKVNDLFEKVAEGSEEPQSVLTSDAKAEEQE